MSYSRDNYPGFSISVFRGESPELFTPEFLAKNPECPKCGFRSGDDWRQCNRKCPRERSPHFDKEAGELAAYVSRDKELSKKKREKLVHLYMKQSALEYSVSELKAALSRVYGTGLAEPRFSQALSLQCDYVRGLPE